MPQIIDVPGYGEVEFPDDMTDEQIVSVIQSNVSKGPKSRPTNPNRGKSNTELAAAGAGRFLGDVGLGATQLISRGLQALGNERVVREDHVGKWENIHDNRQLDPTMREGAAQAGYMGAALVPAVASAFIPGANTIGGAALIGGTFGAAQPVGEDESRVFNTGLGAGAGGAGQGALNLLGRIADPVRKSLSPVQARSVRTLQQADVPLDAAQMTNNPVLQRVRSSLTDNPLTVGGQQAFVSNQKTAYNRAVLSHIGVDADVADEKVMGEAYSRIGQVFDDVLSRTQIRPSSGALAQMKSFEQQSRRVLGGGHGMHGGGNPIENVVGDIREHLKTNGGRMDGAFYQRIRRDLSLLEKKPDVSPIARDLREGLDNTFQQAATPDDAAALKEARRQWRNMRIIENAVDSEGNISAAKLANQFGHKKNRSVGVYGKGDKSVVELAKLAKAGKNVIPDKLPNSGTAARSLMQIGAPAIVGGAYGGYKEGDLTGVGAYALGGAALPFLAQRALNNPAAANYLATGVGSPVVRNALLAPSHVGLGAIPPALLLSQQ
jgi:hypothetical protein